MKRLYPQPVAHQPERLGGGIEKGEGEHAIEPVHALRSPLPPSMQDDFGIAVRAEYMAFGLQLRSDRRVIINLALEGKGKRALVGQHRLRAACMIDDGTHSVAKTHISGGPHPRSSGTSTDNRISHQTKACREIGRTPV